MTAPSFHTVKTLLLAALLCPTLCSAAEIVAEMPDYQTETELNVIGISVSGSTVRVKNAEGLILRIYNITGEEVFSQRIDSASKSIALGQLARGYYIAKIDKFTRKIYLH